MTENGHEMLLALQQELDETRERALRAEADARTLRHLLIRVPHGSGDHTDLCRMANEGLPPTDPELCRCHVALVRNALMK